MSTYVMSDLHGCFDDFQQLLIQAGFSPDDRLIVAGDLIERGPQTYEMFCWMESCPKNVLLLRGNHEEEFIYNISLLTQKARSMYADPSSPRDTIDAYLELSEEDTGFFDYYGSIRELLANHPVSLRDLQRWSRLLMTLPYTCRIRVNGRLYIIVHAGYLEDKKLLPKDYPGLESFYLYAREEACLYGGVPGATVIAGHTPTIIKSAFAYNGGRVYRCSRGDMVFYDIDCGAVFRRQGVKEANMACLRLEDEKTEYLWNN